MRLLRLRLVCEMTTDGVLSAYKGSMLRGAMGHALRRACCNVRGRECADCMLLAVCPHPRLFMPRRLPDGRLLTPPWIIAPEDDGVTDFPAGSAFSFGLTLISFATDFAPWFVHAMARAGERGVGRGAETGAGRFRLRSVECAGVPVYDAEAARLLPLVPEEIPDPAPAPDAGREAVLRVSLPTPCRFKRDNRLSDDLDFPTLLRLILRRIRNVLMLEDRAFVTEGFAGLMEAANGIRTEESSLSWKDWARWSNRQKAGMSLGGLVGEVAYRGRVHPFIPFLEFASRLHIGKQTAFGLGALSFHLEPPE